MIEVNYNEYKETIAENMELIQENNKLQQRIDKAIEYIETESWYCYKDNEKVLDRTPINNLLDILKGENNDK